MQLGLRVGIFELDGVAKHGGRHGRFSDYAGDKQRCALSTLIFVVIAQEFAIQLHVVVQGILTCLFILSHCAPDHHLGFRLRAIRAPVKLFVTVQA